MLRWRHFTLHCRLDACCPFISPLGVLPYRSLSASNNRPGEDSWFKSLFVRKVDPRKDAHSHLLAKKEESNLYKIQCMYYWVLHLVLSIRATCVWHITDDRWTLLMIKPSLYGQERLNHLIWKKITFKLCIISLFLTEPFGWYYATVVLSNHRITNRLRNLPFQTLPFTKLWVLAAFLVLNSKKTRVGTIGTNTLCFD